MKTYLSFLLVILILSFSCINERKSVNQSGKAAPNSFSDFREWAKTPPMGWNSYNSFGAAVTEKDVKANADYMAEKLKKFGWEYIVIDYCWSYPHPPGSIQNNPPQFRLKKDGAYVPWLAMDEFGRLTPDLRKFPSSAGDQGFKPMADYVHGLGLKFGIHIMRGIPRQAVWAKSPVKESEGITADMIADTASVCEWLNQMYGVNMELPGAQEYYNSLAALYASWGVDYIKMDDIDLNNGEPDSYRAAEAEAMHKAILKCGRPIVLSLSPHMNYENRNHMKSVSNLWRISNDFWDDWESLKNQFELSDLWSSSREPGSWPDADMLQLGWISRRGPSGPERESRFTRDEQMTHMFLWCIAQSPLMMGGDMPDNNEFVEKLMTNAELLSANQNAEKSRQLYCDNGKIVWCSNIPGSSGMYLAFFNLTDTSAEIGVFFNQLGIKTECNIRDIWLMKDIGTFTDKFSDKVNPHGAKIFRVNPK
jgi:alpha-galactosidase